MVPRGCAGEVPRHLQPRHRLRAAAQGRTYAPQTAKFAAQGRANAAQTAKPAARGRTHALRTAKFAAQGRANAPQTAKSAAHGRTCAPQTAIICSAVAHLCSADRRICSSAGVSTLCSSSSRLPSFCTCRRMERAKATSQRPTASFCCPHSGGKYATTCNGSWYLGLALRGLEFWQTQVRGHPAGNRSGVIQPETGQGLRGHPAGNRSGVIQPGPPGCCQGTTCLGCL